MRITLSMAIEVAKKMELDARTQQLLESEEGRILGEASSGHTSRTSAVGLVGAGVVAASKFYPRFRNANLY